MNIKDRSASHEPPLYAHGKSIARQIFHDVMVAVDVRQTMLRKLKREDGTLMAGDASISLARPPHVVAIGKAAARMTAALDEILGGHIAKGVVVAPATPTVKLKSCRYFIGGHPYPNSDSLAGAQTAREMVAGLSPEDTVIFLISGGGSALFEEPLDSTISLNDLAEFNRVLVTCGLPIEQINILRKHLSAVKGGRLARAAYPARQLTIYISDVPADLPAMIASGPTMPDDSTVEQCYRLAFDHDLVRKFPAAVRRHFDKRTLEETPKAGAPCFANSYYVCLLSNNDAVDAAKKAAEDRGFVATIDGSEWDVDYRELADRNLVSVAMLAEEHPGRPVALIAGGEVTCPVTGSGMGGRNQAFALYAACQIERQNRIVLSAGTDGRDGNSPSDGAVADGQTISRGRARGLDPGRYLAESDSYSFFRTLGDTLDIGFTENNVRDVRLWLDFGSQ